ncbi:MAG: adenylate/guanylate cyclase domain-containing protein [Spirochaetales bacterium]|nr:adenylate/guanylate cyclase domain-containing protein [Spirochaetales bacterium]
MGKTDIAKKILQTKNFGFIIGFIIFILLLILTYRLVVIDFFERSILDFHFNFRKDILSGDYGVKKTREGLTTITYNPNVSEDIVLIGIDTRSLDEFGKWPFPRSVEANLINTLTRISDQSQRELCTFLDINFIERDMELPVNDILLIDSIRENGRIFLEAFFHSTELKQQIAENHLERLRQFIDQFGVVAKNNINGDWKNLIPYRGVECPLKPYIEVAHAYGNVSYYPDPDRIFRRQPLVARFCEVVKEINLDTLTPDEPISPDAFEYIGWVDQEDIVHYIPSPLTQEIVDNLKKQLEDAGAPKKEEDTDGDGKIDYSYFIIRKYRDFIIPSITLTLALKYFNKRLDDIEIDLDNYIRIPFPQRYNPITQAWERLVETEAVYKYPEVLTESELVDLLRRADPAQKNILGESYEKNSLFEKYMLKNTLDQTQLFNLRKTLTTLGNEEMKLVREATYKDEIKIPIDKHGRMLINFMGKPSTSEGVQTFRVKPFHRYVRDPGPDPENWRRTNYFENKILVIGMFATGLADEKPTPYGLMFGPEVNANSLNTIIMDNFLVQSPDYLNIIILFVIIMLVSLITSRLPTPLALAFVFLLLLVFFIAGNTIFDQLNYIITISASLFGGVLTFVSIVVYRVITEERDKKKIKNTFGKYVSPTVVESLLIDPPELGGVDKDLTVLFSDIRGFTSISERMTPQGLVNHLNEYLTAMTDLILEYRGTLDKYIGDAIMCFWGAPLAEPEHALIACMCALKQMEILNSLNAHWPEEKNINIGIGLNSGTMTVGNMGSPIRMNYTLMGDNVNLGSRLEAINKEYSTNIVISEYTYGRVKDKVVVRELDNIRVKGKNKPVIIYELIDMIDTYEIPAVKKVKSP